MNQEQIKAIKEAIKIADAHAKTGIDHNPGDVECSLCVTFYFCARCPLNYDCAAPTEEASAANKEFYREVAKTLRRALNER